MMTLLLALALAVPSASAPRSLGDDAGVCRAIYPRDLRAWPAGRALARPSVGRPFQLTLHAAAGARPDFVPSKPSEGVYYASARLEIAQRGSYRLAVGGIGAPVRPLWIDIAGADGTPIASTAHEHGPDCTSITKIVEYELNPGRYTILATGLKTDAPIRVLIVRK